VDVTSDQILKAALTPRWAALSQIGGGSADLANFDPGLVREPRLLVPVDVQALVVRAGVNDQDPMLRLPFRDDADSFPPLDVHDAGLPREAGVHLLWSVPSALGQGTLEDDPAAPGDATRRRLVLPALPDRWVVLRLAVPAGAGDPLVRGWVVEADAATVTPLADWPSVTTSTVSLGTAVDPAQLTAHTGGTGWAQCYDAAAGRLSLHDPLDDLAGVSLEGDAISYVVAGWWSASAADPLDGVGTEAAYVARLASLGWADPDHPSTNAAQVADAAERHRAARAFGYTDATRFTQPAAEPAPAGAAAGQAGVAPGTGSGYVAPAARAVRPEFSGFLHDAVTAASFPSAPTRQTLLHGRLHGVPLSGAVAPDSRPAAQGLRVVLGSTTPDLAAVLSVAGAGLGGADEDARRAAERLLEAFAAGQLMNLGDSTVWADIDDYEHAHGFGSLPGGTEGVDRYVDKAGPPVDPGSGFRAGTAPAPEGDAVRARRVFVPESSVLWSATQRPATSSLVDARRAPSLDGRLGSVPPPAPAQVREVVRPAPRWSYPASPVLGVAGGGRTLSAVEREEADGALVCRLADQTSKGHLGVLAAQELLATIGSAAVPPEVLDLAREALAEDPYLSAWRARLAAGKGFASGLARSRFVAEAAVSYAYYAADDARLQRWSGAPVSSAYARQRATEGLLRLSLSDGTWAHPEGVSLWGQPWRPLFCDWEARLDLGGLTGWQLVGTDNDPTGDPSPTTPDTVVFCGRSPLVTGAAGTLANGINRWLDDERARDLGGHGLADPQTEAALAALSDTLAHLDLLSVAMDGIREQLLGLAYDRGLVRLDSDTSDDGTRRASAVALPRLLEAGRLTLSSARLVDAFGRTLDLPLDALLVPARVSEDALGEMRLRPRLTAPARWRFDLVDATSTSVDAALACVDQADASRQVSPIAGYLLPDHMDESLEVFSGDGKPLGELSHDPFSDAVQWEIAPGREDVAPGAGPTDDPDATHHRVGWIAAGLVAADAAERQGTPDRPETESALSAMLRAIDTTLWTVDPFGSLGTEHIAGLVGRPIAVVTARLALDVHSDVDELVYVDGVTAQDRQAAYDALAQLAIQVKLGDVTRADDSLLGYFVDDDFSRFHLVDRVVAEEALASGRCRGVLDLADPDPTAADPITHPYVDPTGSIVVHPGQTVRLTLLMHPGGKVYLTTGILPRTAKALARDWVNPGLSVLAPSLRVGPLLIDADKVRLPKVASFPVAQLFTRRDTPTTWKDDPILAATQNALLPDQEPVVQEGWVRIDPNPPAQGSGS